MDTLSTRGTGRTIAVATLVAGTLDILSACVYAGIAGHTPGQMLTGLAGAIGADTLGDIASPLAGLALHFAIMAVIAAVYVAAMPHIAMLGRKPILGGIVYGLIVWAVMNLIVLPLRFGWHPFHALGLGEQLFSHIVLVGIPIALIAARRARA